MMISFRFSYARHVLWMNQALSVDILIFLYNFCCVLKGKSEPKCGNDTKTMKNDVKNYQNSQYLVCIHCKTWRACENVITMIFRIFWDTLFDSKSEIRKIKECSVASEPSTPGEWHGVIQLPSPIKLINYWIWQVKKYFERKVTKKRAKVRFFT